MSELAVSIGVLTIIALIVWRYKTVFCLPFFWPAIFTFIYLGLLQIHVQSGGSSYLYAAEGFGMYFLGLLAAEFLFFYRPGRKRFKNRNGNKSRNARDPDSTGDSLPRPTRIRLLFPALPLNVGLFVSLSAATLVTIIFFSERGLPILASNPALAWVQSTSGVVNRLMSVFGPGCYAILGLIGWAIYRETHIPMAKAMMYLGLGLAVVAQGLLATKSAAIMVFVWFNILLFYMNKKRELWKTLLPLVIIVVPVSAAIVAVRMVSTQGYWETGSIIETYYERLTTIAAEPLDFAFKYSNRFGSENREGFRLEAKRIREQLTGARKTPILSEFVYNIMEGLPPDSVDLSVTLTPQGVGYIEWGMAGLLLYSFLQGLGFGLIHRHLFHQETTNLISLVVWGAIVAYGIQLSSTGTILVGLEGILLSSIPALALVLPFGAFFLLPVARRYRNTAGGRISGFPQVRAEAGRAAER